MSGKIYNFPFTHKQAGGLHTKHTIPFIIGQIIAYLFILSIFALGMIALIRFLWGLAFG